MYRLRLFGGLALEEATGVHAGKAAQRRRLALLALLETAPRRTLTRDKLLGLLWTDEDAESGRHRLSVVLHEIRKALGEDAIRAVGDDVTLNHEVVASDVADFNAALTASDFERAVELYDGPFLDGVFLSGAPEFERWAETERAKWARMHRTALERLAESLETRSDHVRAAETWQKLSVADPYNSRIAVRYMNALADTGEVAGALKFARVHELLIKEELRAEPSAEFRAAVERLERGVERSKPRLNPPATPSPASVAAPSVTSPPLPHSPRRHLRFRKGQRKAAAGSVAIVFALLLIAGFIYKLIDDSGVAGADDNKITLVVLPFANYSDNRSNEHLSDGLTEEMISAFSKVAGFNVPPHTTVRIFKTQNVDVREVARQLKADYVMEGSVRRAGDDLRITVRVMDEAGEEVWTESFDRRMDDIFQVQREIAGATADALRGQLDRDIPAPAMDYTTENPEAYELYLRGRSAWLSRAPDRLQAALTYFNQAVARDSTYALAYAGIADVYNMFGAYNYGLARPVEVYPKARAAATHALRLNPKQAEAHAALGLYLYNYEWKFDDAERELDTALKYNPGYAMAQHWLELVLLINDKKDKALEVVRKAREQDPGSPLISSALAHHYYYRREFNKAVREYHDAIKLDSTFVVARFGLAMSYVAVGEHAKAIEQANAGLKITGDVPVSRTIQAFTLASAGKHAEARAILAGLEGASKTHYVAPHFLAIVHVALGDETRALDALEASYKERSGAMLYLLLEPPLEVLYDQPRFRTLVQRVHKRIPPELAARP